MLERVIAQLENKRIVVLGAGLTGMSCVRFLNQHQLACSVNDSRENVIEKSEFKESFPLATLTLGTWDHSAISKAQILLVSPGIDLKAENISSHINDDCLVMGDVELFCQLTNKPILAVTGSNGKSTVVSLLAYVGQQLGFNIALGGNIGTPVLEQLSDKIDCYVLELSSFQLETLKSMKAVAATVLNISDDHLDRHITIENYSQIKQKIFNQTTVAIVNRDDPASYSTLTMNNCVNQTSNCQLISFGSDDASEGNFGLAKDNHHYYLTFGSTKLIAINTLPLAGIHNALNYLAVLALGYSAGWSLAKMVESLAGFEGLEHRCQRVQSTDGISWINDSKATNVGATLAAINGLSLSLPANNQLILLAGGEGKGADFSLLQAAFDQHVAHVFTLGKDGKKIAELHKQSEHVADLATAVKRAKAVANKGDVVLLSPACASIDMFKNFAERGQVFTAAVQALQEAC